MTHAERAHALLSASGASRWLACPPSARLTDSIEDKSSDYAKEGTVAHELAEIKLRQWLGVNDSKARAKLANALKKTMADPFYNEEMESAIEDYKEYVGERHAAARARTKDAVTLFEERLDFSEWVPDGFGTGDVLIIADGVMEVIDLKYGKGVPVSAVGNPQMRLYALGAWQAYNFLYDISEIHMTIVQPQLDSISTDIISVEDLLEWAETVVKPAADLAFAGEGEFQSGEHCRWCKVKATCKARADANLAALSYEFQDPVLLTLEEIGSVLYVAEELQKWAKDVAEYAFEQAKAGKTIPQWKLVEGRSSRAITDEEAVKAKLQEAGYEESKFIKPGKLAGIGDLEKLVGKKPFASMFDGLVVKPPGKPTLVPESDPRPQLNSIDSDFAGEDFDG